jgi:carbon storage regulator
MLVLGRRNGEEIVIPQHGIVLSILEIQGDRVKVGISAPGDVGIYRQELWQRIRSNHDAGHDVPAGGTCAGLARVEVECLSKRT